ncbi:MAG: Spy/CpxP family protein refolding chaperone [Deltaproteobacteria bacterium]|nr:Spy/CpxP family protein refolding chaperone [Deltaproteobacteria bacterium]
MMKRTLTIGTILLLVGTLAVPVFAWGPGRWSGKDGYGPGACWNDGGSYGGTYGATALSAEERAKVDDLYRTHHEKTAPVRERLWARQAEMRSLLAAENVDEGRVKELQREINELRAELSDQRTELEVALSKMGANTRLAAPYGRGYGGRGYGWGHGRHMMGGGYGPGNGPGSCWY